jgi:superfamily I DNA/RNA helicase
VLFRSRDSHREFEKALERRGVSTYVYKGLGFFDADEIQDGVALLRYLADPLSDLGPARSFDPGSSACRTRRSRNCSRASLAR